jgi:alkylation response protein AidB-like acyl-CoA dehydrogenase
MMYSFTPTEEQKMLIEVVSRFAHNDLRPVAREAEEGEDFSKNLIEKGWELGMLQASIPEEYGGFGERSAVTGVLALEEMAWGDLAGTLAVMVPGLFALPILLCGSEEQKQTYLPKIAESEWQPYTAALIERDFDFDPNDLQTIAQKEENTFILDGEKVFVPFADRANKLLVYARLEGVTQGFIVDREAPGLSIGERHQLLGIHALPNYPVKLSGVRVPAENRLGGPEGHPFGPILDSARVAMAAAAVGLSRAAFEYARDYAKEREAFGVKIAQKQAIAFMLAEMATEIEAIRLLTWEAAWMQDRQKTEASKAAYLALTGAMDMAMMVTDRAVQVLGGHGYIREYPVEMWMRNGRGISALSGLALI